MPLLAFACGLLVVPVVSACGGAAAEPPSAVAERTVAGRFASAVLGGDELRARLLLLRPDETALRFLVRRATTTWKARRASVSLPARKARHGWRVRYAGRRTYPDGRFETEHGDLVVLLGPSPTGARVRFFLFTNVRVRASTHHDARLLPSER